MPVFPFKRMSFIACFVSQALIPLSLHKELASKRIFCLARGGPTAAVGKHRYVKMSEGYGARACCLFPTLMLSSC